jgi:hypothetical protein
MKAMLMGSVCAALLMFAVLTVHPARAQNDPTTQSLLMSILQQLVLIEQHTRAPYPLTQ